VKYMGSKSRFAKELLPIILTDRRPNQTYVEPFAGGMNVISLVESPRVANDSNYYLIEMWRLLVSLNSRNNAIIGVRSPHRLNDAIIGVKLPCEHEEITKEKYSQARDAYKSPHGAGIDANLTPGTETSHGGETSLGEKVSFGGEASLNWKMPSSGEMSPGMIGWIGFVGSFNGRFFDGGYSGTVGGRNYIKEAAKNIKKQIPLMKDVEFHNVGYDELNIPPRSIIYCDPPYAGTKQYSACGSPYAGAKQYSTCDPPYAVSKGFDHVKFWQWCREKAREGHSVFISEYNAPDDFECVWQKNASSSLSTANVRSVEKLFIPRVNQTKETKERINETDRACGESAT
jgi:site-specific DNA-adenine methylase